MTFQIAFSPSSQTDRTEQVVESLADFRRSATDEGTTECRCNDGVAPFICKATGHERTLERTSREARQKSWRKSSPPKSRIHSEKPWRAATPAPRRRPLHSGRWAPPQPATTKGAPGPLRRVRACMLSRLTPRSRSSMPPRVLAPTGGVTRVLLLSKWEVDILTCF